jgi:MSHA biogenesis protein MshK
MKRALTTSIRMMMESAIKRSGKNRVAVIGGQEIAVGGRYQDARVVKISESEVVLRRGGETTVLKLYPQVEKRPRGQ